MNKFRSSLRHLLGHRHQLLRSVRSVLIRLLFASLLLPAAGAWAQNFSSPDPDICRAAEAAREQSALFWLGRPLPGDWYQPCPVVWQVRTGTGSGWTAFQIQNGEVSGWRMSLRGNRNTVLRDVIPHEVDHAVRASLCRRPLPRWLDEGCASLFESAESHAQLRQQLMTSQRRFLTSTTIDQMDYPASGSDTTQLYAEGFSFVEYLLSRGTPQEVLQLQQTQEPLSHSLVQVYRQELPQLLQDWHEWERGRVTLGTRCDCVHCPWHRSPATTNTRPGANKKAPLTIWSATWCAPCQNFHRDLDTLPQFRKQLEAKFRLIERDIDQSPQAARQANITTVPTFGTGSRRITGYLGPDWLLQQLSASTPTTPKDQSNSPSANSSGPPSNQEPNPKIAPLSSSPDAIQPAVPAPLNPTPGKPSTRDPAPTSEPEREAKPAASLPTPLKSHPPWSRIFELAPTALTILSTVGVIGGTAATGGVGGIALMILFKLLKRRATRTVQGKVTSSATSSEGGAAHINRAPFPRQLDEAGELLGLRQSEGRVATLDTLRGLFLDDELDKLKSDSDPQVAAVIRRIRNAVDSRVDEVAPLTTKV